MLIRRFRFVLGLLILLLLMGTKAGPTHATSGGVTFKPTDDTFVESDSPTANYGLQVYLQIQNYQSNSVLHESIVWLKFNLSTVPDGAVIDEATLQLYTFVVDETFNVQAYSGNDFLNVIAKSSWTELTLTYSNMPSYNTTSMDSQSVTTINQLYNWSVEDAVRNALKSNDKVVTIVLLDPIVHSSVLKWVWFSSKEYPSNLGDYGPALTVHWSGVVSEFPTFLILPFFMIATLVTAMFRKKDSPAYAVHSKKTTKLQEDYETDP